MFRRRSFSDRSREVSVPRFFPPATSADEFGLVAVGGRLTTEWLLDAYTHGIFPWPHIEHGFATLAWYSPDPRAILEFDALRLDEGTRRSIKKGDFRLSIDADFAGVIAGCAETPRKVPPRLQGTWITPAIQRAYCQLHAEGHAHSVEVWLDDCLVGGVYGVAVGGYFAGESMFHRATNASKIALKYLVDHLADRGFLLFDVQASSPHLTRLGAIEISRHEFLRRLQPALAQRVSFDDDSSIPAAE